MLHEIRQAYYLMGTIVEFTLYIDNTKLEANLVLDKVFLEFKRIEKVFSYFDSSSELSNVNITAHLEPVKVSKEFFDIVALAVKYSKFSKKTFSIILAPLTKLWQKAAVKNQLPSLKKIKKVKALTKPKFLKLNSKKKTVFFQKKGMSLDLSGFVKGYAIDLVKKILLQMGVISGMVNAGNSSVITWGEFRDNPFWQLGIKHLQNQSVIAVLDLNNVAISTSGTNEKFSTIENKFFSNLLNPKTGYPIDYLISATVLCKSALEAEVISKILIFLGKEKTLDVCEKNSWFVDNLLVQKLDKNNNTLLSYTADLPIAF